MTITNDPVEQLNIALDNAFTIAVDWEALPTSDYERILKGDFLYACKKMNLPSEEHCITISHVPNPSEAKYIRCMVLVSPLFLAELEKLEPEQNKKPIWIRMKEAGLTAEIYNPLKRERL